MRATLNSRHVAEISNERNLLTVLGPDGDALFSIGAPANASFYHFAEHAVEGQCPIVSFDPGHTISGWPDWYFKINVRSRSIERLNPWR